jgi:hypothetical protein
MLAGTYLNKSSAALGKIIFWEYRDCGKSENLIFGAARVGSRPELFPRQADILASA